MVAVNRWLNVHHVHRRGAQMGGLILLAAALEVAAAVGLAYVAGFSTVDTALHHFDWPWLPALVGALAISFVGYYFAYLRIYRVDGGDRLDRRQMLSVVSAGFGGFLAHGGATLDQYAVEATGASERTASVRVAALAGLEHGVLALGGTVAAITLLAAGVAKPPADFKLPWAIIPVPGFLLGFWLAERYRARFRRRGGWRRKLGVFLDSIHIIRELFRTPFANGAAPFTMGLFWAADILAMWLCLAAFGFRMNVASLIVGYATGMVFTRRTGPLGGAGVLMLVLPLTLWYSGAPLAVAVLGVFVFRGLSLWLPLPFSLASLPTLREIGERGVPHAEGEAEAENEPALRKHPNKRRS